MAPIRCCFDQTAVWHSDAARGPSTPSLDYLVGDGEQRRRHVKAERLGSLKIDDQLVLSRGLHRQIAGLFPLEDTVDSRLVFRLQPEPYRDRPTLKKPFQMDGLKQMLQSALG